MTAAETPTIAIPPFRRACLVEGCACKDARFVSMRRTAYFASVAVARGETANRVITPDPAWTLAASPGFGLLDGAA